MNELPDVIQAFLSGYTSTGENLRTSSKTEVYFYSCPDRPGLFLKIRHIDESPREAALHTEAVFLSDGTLEREPFRGTDALHEVVRRACREGRDERFESMAAFHAAWAGARRVQPRRIFA